MSIENRDSLSVGAIVIGGHFQGLGVIRALAKKDVPVVLVDHEPCLAKCSRYVQHFFKSPHISNEKEYLDFLIKLAQTHNLSKWVIFSTDDETVYFLSKYHKQLSEWFQLITPEWEITKYVYNKKLTYQLAEKIGIPVPKTWYPESEKDLKEVNRFPVVVKPAVMRSFFKKTGKKVFVAKNRGELIKAYKEAEHVIPRDEILIQKQLMNVTENLYSYCPVIFKNHVLGRIVAKRPRQHPMDFGQASTYAVTVQCPEIETLGKQFLDAINYYGLGEVEFIFDQESGEYKLLEVNPRIWGWHTLALPAGVNLCYLAYSFINDLSIDVKDYSVGVKWCRLMTDIPIAISEIFNGRLTVREYFKSLRGKKEWAVWSFKDPKPFFLELILLPYLLCKRGF